MEEQLAAPDRSDQPTDGNEGLYRSYTSNNLELALVLRMRSKGDYTA